ncbi:hypothetical protein [uncultured Mobiluncus sp.]|uniref:hypothetical protein n=1 Tax=uncultured Mobiluncus sp. TaxID=293425 RepID=UPI00262BC057|nr:hypothetical protein [uncultured Mobiluncus sp.]
MSLTAETPLPVLYRSLARGGWGALAGAEWQGVRSTLGALVARHTRKGLDVTVWQVSQSAGLSEKWTARCLYILEGLGLIRWQRGLIEEGKPKPGHVQIMRHVLLDLVRQAWKQGQAAWAARREATARRLALLKKQDANIRRSRHTELSADLNSVSLSAPSAEREIHTTTPPPAWAVGKEETMEDADALLCDHGYLKDSDTCPHCHPIQDNRNSDDTRKRWTKAQRKAYENERARRNWAELERRTREDRQLAAAEFRREHPCPPDVDPADWGRVYINRLLAGVKS